MWTPWWIVNNWFYSAHEQPFIGLINMFKSGSIKMQSKIFFLTKSNNELEWKLKWQNYFFNLT